MPFLARDPKAIEVVQVILESVLLRREKTMRDKDGRPLVNAHILGFLRRICKLLFYGIKPVFVFDGGAPVLKKATIVCPI